MDSCRENLNSCIRLSRGWEWQGKRLIAGTVKMKRAGPFWARIEPLTKKGPHQEGSRIAINQPVHEGVGSRKAGLKRRPAASNFGCRMKRGGEKTSERGNSLATATLNDKGP